MSQRKWGESFLKSGMPLEHITLITLKSSGFLCSPNIEYLRLDEKSNKSWFEIDLYANSRKRNKDTHLSFLIECKYHDLSRFWFFLPCETDRWLFNDRILNCGPFQTLTNPMDKKFFSIAPLSYRGIVVSEDGSKQINSVYTAIQQIANAFVPVSLSRMYGYLLGVGRGYTPINEALIPMIVTNARLFRLKPDITDLDVIRKSSTPGDIADELDWTWCYHDPTMELFDRNIVALESHLKKEKEKLDKYPICYKRLELWADRPNWISVVNIGALDKVIKMIEEHFLSINMCKVKTAMKSDRKVRVI